MISLKPSFFGYSPIIIVCQKVLDGAKYEMQLIDEEQVTSIQ